MITQKEENERRLQLIDKRDDEHTAKIGEMRLLQGELDKKIQKLDGLKQKEAEILDQENKNIKKSEDLLHQEKLISIEKETLRERKIQLDKLEQQRKTKLEKLNRMLDG